MAILKGPIKLEGRVGDLIFYRRGNKTCCRSMPSYKPESMTAASKQSAREFGQASKAGKVLRHALNDLWPVPQDNGMINRLNKTLYSALRKDAAHRRGKRVITPAALQETLKGFSFNNKASLRFDVATSRRANGHIQVTLPENWLALLRMPTRATGVEVQVAALSLDFATGASQTNDAVTDYITVGSAHNGSCRRFSPGQPQKIPGS